MTEKKYGKYRAIVKDVNDPERRGRIRVQCPKILGEYLSAWCEPCIPYATDYAGDFYVPPIGEAVWVEFEEGDIDKPIWNGGWYKRNSTPLLPQSSPDEYRYIIFKNAVLRIGETPNAENGEGEFVFNVLDKDKKVLGSLSLNKQGCTNLGYIATLTEDKMNDLASLIDNKWFLLEEHSEGERQSIPYLLKTMYEDLNTVSQALTVLTGNYNTLVNAYNDTVKVVNSHADSIPIIEDDLSGIHWFLDHQKEDWESTSGGILQRIEALENNKADKSTTDAMKEAYNDSIDDFYMHIDFNNIDYNYNWRHM